VYVNDAILNLYGIGFTKLDPNTFVAALITDCGVPDA